MNLTFYHFVLNIMSSTRGLGAAESNKRRGFLWEDGQRGWADQAALRSWSVPWTPGLSKSPSLPGLCEPQAAFFSLCHLLDGSPGPSLRMWIGFDSCLPFSFLKGNTGNALKILFGSRFSFSLSMWSKTIIVSCPDSQGCSLTLGGGQVTFPSTETSAVLTPVCFCTRSACQNL